MNSFLIDAYEIDGAFQILVLRSIKYLMIACNKHEALTLTHLGVLSIRCRFLCQLINGGHLKFHHFFETFVLIDKSVLHFIRL